MNPSNTTTAQQVCSLIFHSEDGKSVAQQLHPESMVIIGSDPQCGLVIPCDDVATRHCMVRMSDGEMFVSDWFSESGTFVNEQRVSEETLIQFGDELRVGPHTIQLIRHQIDMAKIKTPAPKKPAAPRPAPTAEAIAKPTAPAAPAPFIKVDTVKLDEAIEIETNGDADLRGQLAAAHDEIQRLKSELADQICDASPLASLDSVDVAALQQEVEFLRSELTQLQGEMAEQEQSQATAWADADCESAESGDENDSEFSDSQSLLARLEQLLDELQTADRRILTLEDLLRSSDDMNRAEQDERQQLEVWLDEIEQRVTQREQNWQAERERLEAKIQQLADQRSQIQRHLNDTQHARTDPKSKQLLEDWQRKYEASQQALDDTRDQLAQAQSQLSTVADTVERAKQADQLEDELRKQQVEISQERAALARQRVALEKAMAEGEQAGRSLTNAEETDVRFKAFRAHLRGIHEQEQLEQKQRSLSARIARLWKRTDRG